MEMERYNTQPLCCARVSFIHCNDAEILCTFAIVK